MKKRRMKEAQCLLYILIIILIIIIIIISLFPHDRCIYKLVFISVMLHMKKEEAEVQYL